MDTDTIPDDVKAAFRRAWVLEDELRRATFAARRRDAKNERPCHQSRAEALRKALARAEAAAERLRPRLTELKDKAKAERWARHNGGGECAESSG